MIRHSVSRRRPAVAVNASADDCCVELPPVGRAPSRVTVTREDSSENVVTVHDAEGRVVARPAAGEELTLIVSGSEWSVVERASVVSQSSGTLDPSALWPVGSVFITTSDQDPADLLGFGTWEVFAAGRVLVGLDSEDSDFDTAAATGGAKTVAASGSNDAPTFTGSQGSTSSDSAGTPAGTNSAPTFTGSALGTHSHGVGSIATSSHAGTAVADHASHTHSVTSNVSGTLTPAGTIAWPAGVPTHSGITISDHASHTHTYTDVPNHTHTIQMQGSATPATTGTHICNSTATGGSSRASTSPDATNNPTGGVSTGTTAGPSATLSHTVSSQGTVAWPAGVPTFTGTSSQSVSMTNPAVTSGAPSATLSHSVTQPSDHTLSGSTAAVSAGTPAGSVSAPTFTGDALGTHAHTLTPAGSVSAPAFTGSPTSVVQPFVVVRMWRRTA